MSDAKNLTNELKEKAEKATELAKNIWLAGLGAYGKAVNEAQEQFGKVNEKVNQESNRLFDELVAKGKEVEGQTQGKFVELKEKSTATFEERLAQVKEGLSFAAKKNDLSAKVDELSAKLDLIIKALPKTAKKGASDDAAA